MLRCRGPTLPARRTEAAAGASGALGVLPKPNRTAPTGARRLETLTEEELVGLESEVEALQRSRQVGSDWAAREGVSVG